MALLLRRQPFRAAISPLNGWPETSIRRLATSHHCRQAEFVNPRSTYQYRHPYQRKRFDQSQWQEQLKAPVELKNPVKVTLDYENFELPSLALRDLCPCPLCIDQSTKQKLFSTTDIPGEVEAKSCHADSQNIVIEWTKDIPGYPADHKTELPLDVVRRLLKHGKTASRQEPLTRVLWGAQTYEGRTRDFDYETYMSDDSVLLEALQQLYTYGLLFITDVPESEKSVETVAERIGPLKTTFYGRTWDVRSVPDAINVAFTAQNLGFHMDLMYLKQPPHLQLLHCIRSSAAGGASLFTDSFKAAVDLSDADKDSFDILSRTPVDFHYDHPDSQYYYQSRTVIEQTPRRFGNKKVNTHAQLSRYLQDPEKSWMPKLDPIDFIEDISWSPPFQAPFSLAGTLDSRPDLHRHARALGHQVSLWHGAAQKFDALIHRPEGIYERLMKPGELVIFDNRRVLHARRAFEVGDAGKDRWLRGAYIDKDPYMSQLRILTERNEIKAA